MRVVDNPFEHTFDVDYTIVFPLHNVSQEDGQGHERVIIDTVCFVVNEHIVNEMITAKARGQYVTVWSQGGAKWAEKVIKALELENVVDEVRSKPRWGWDDKAPAFWLENCYKNLKGEYKGD